MIVLVLFLGLTIASIATYNILSPAKFPLLSLINRSQNPWWIEIKTSSPCCTYFFGPFDSFQEARHSQDGYIEDLVDEKAFGITVEIKQCQPNLLTMFEESYDRHESNRIESEDRFASEHQSIKLDFC